MSRKEKILSVGVAKRVEFSSIPEYGDVMTMDEFEECVAGGLLTPYDGSGYYAVDGQMSDVSVWSVARPGQFTHVVWFNK